MLKGRHLGKSERWICGTEQRLLWYIQLRERPQRLINIGMFAGSAATVTDNDAFDFWKASSTVLHTKPKLQSELCYYQWWACSEHESGWRHAGA
jgi:hypothetical protein